MRCPSLRDPSLRDPSLRDAARTASSGHRAARSLLPRSGTAQAQTCGGKLRAFNAELLLNSVLLTPH
ncbi:hypothetical protein [Nostoc sp.]